MNMLEIIFSILLYLGFAVIHSILASEKIKTGLVELVGDKIAFYRLFYNTVSILTIYIIWIFMPNLNHTVYDLKNPYDMITLIPQFFGIVGLIWASKYMCFKEFIGLSQINRYFAGTYNKDELDENSFLIVEGPFKYSRHPLYFFIIVILVFRPYMDVQYLIFVSMMVLYFYIGTYFEEKKLLNKFGNDYLEYSSKVSRIIPLKIWRG